MVGSREHDIHEEQAARQLGNANSWPLTCVGTYRKPVGGFPGRCLPLLWLALFGILAGVCFWNGLSGDPPAESAPMLATAASTASPQYRTKRIDEIRVGDIVMARDEFGNELGLKRVVEVYRRISDHLRILKFESDGGTTQTLETTDEHPFWVVNQDRFVNAAQLSVGDQFSGPNGEATRLVSTEYELHPEGVPVYNFQVEDYHTYFVNGGGNDVTPILVHNTCPPNPYGRHGSPAHVAKIREAEMRLQDKGWTPLSGGSLPEAKYGNRFPDLVMEKDGKQIAVQVGRRTKTQRIPIARERRARADLQNYVDPVDGQSFDHVFFVEY